MPNPIEIEIDNAGENEYLAIRIKVNSRVRDTWFVEKNQLEEFIQQNIIPWYINDIAKKIPVNRSVLYAMLCNAVSD